MNFTLFVMRFIITLKPIIKFKKFEKNFTTIVPQIFKRNERIVYTERSDVTESTVTVRSPCCGFNLALRVQLKGEDLWSYSDKNKSVSLRKM